MVGEAIDGHVPFPSRRLEHAGEEGLREEESREPETHRLALLVPRLRSQQEKLGYKTKRSASFQWLTPTLKNTNRWRRSEK